MRSLPDSSVDLILTDPPFFQVKKDEWWDCQWEKPAAFLSWLDKVAEQWQRLLRPNGSLYCFASPRMAARVEVMLGDRFNVLNSIRWYKSNGNRNWCADKEQVRSFLPNTESIIFCEHYGSDEGAKDESGYWSKCDEAAQAVWGNYIKQIRAEHKLSSKQLTEVVGAYGTVNHGGACSNWEKGKNCPTPEHYAKLQLAFPGYFERSYESLRQEYESLRQEYESLRRPFSVTADVPYTDVWTFPTVGAYPGKHPCEKPLELLQHIISASTRSNAVVLDCFAGSGSTLIAAKSLGRQAIGIEIDPHWISRCCQRLGHFKYLPSEQEREEWLEKHAPGVSKPKLLKVADGCQQLTIFNPQEATA